MEGLDSHISLSRYKTGGKTSPDCLWDLVFFRSLQIALHWPLTALQSNPNRARAVRNSNSFFLIFTNLILTAGQGQCLLHFPHSLNVKFVSIGGLEGSSGPSSDTLILPSGPASIHPPVLSSLAKGKVLRQLWASLSSADFTAIQLLGALARFSISTCARHRPKDSTRGSRHSLLKPVVWKTPLS